VQELREVDDRVQWVHLLVRNGGDDGFLVVLLHSHVLILDDFVDALEK